MEPKANTHSAILKFVAVGGLFSAWFKVSVDVFNFAWQILSISPKEETLEAVTKAVCGNCQEHYDEDEYHLIHGTHLCDACR